MPRKILLAAASLALTTGAAPAQPSQLPLPHAADTAALRALSTGANTAVVRDGYAAAGDAPALRYTASASACSLNAGAGDGGFQVKSADGKCWLAAAMPQYDIREWGFSTTDAGANNAAALTAIFADTGSHAFYIPPGTFKLACGARYNAASGISLVGAGANRSVLKMASACTMNRALMAWASKSNVRLANWTLDLNNSTFSALTNVLQFQAYAANTSGLTIDHFAEINGNTNSFQVGIAAAGGFSYSGVAVTNSYFQMTPATSQNQCVGLSTVGGKGFIPSAQVNHNVCNGSGIQLDGAHTQAIGNDISNFQFGTGLFAVFVGGNGVTRPSNQDCVIAGNRLHDTSAGVDVNHTAHGGLENNCVNAVIRGNKAYNLGGAGFYNFANGARFIDNTAYDNGKNGAGGAGGILDTAGFAVSRNGTTSPVYQSQNVTFSGNIAYDDGPGAQMFGYAEEPYNTFSSVLKGNSFKGVTQGQLIQPGSSTTVSDGAGPG